MGGSACQGTRGATEGTWQLDVGRASLMQQERVASAYQPSPDVRLVRDMWMRKGGHSRVHAVKFMWGLFACNELAATGR